jgi:hypothetical protein
MSLRKIIRESIESVLEMREKITHFQDRIDDRLLGDYTTFTSADDKTKKIVFDDIAYLRNIDFDEKNKRIYNLGFFTEVPNVYVYHNPTKLDKKTGRPEHSEGKYIWYIVRGNELDTVVLGHRGYRPADTQYFIEVSELKKYLDSKGRRKITDSDIRVLTAPDIEIIQRIKDFVVTIDGVKWALDKNTQELYKKNKPSTRYNAWDVLDDKIVDVKLSDSAREALENELLQEGIRRRK